MVSRTLSLLQDPALGGSDKSYLLIKLSGLIHSTDRLCLREMARQLCVGGFGTASQVAAEMLDGDETGEHAGLDDDGGSFTSYANTLNSLLGVLEPVRAEFDGDEGDHAGSREDAAARVTERARPLVIVLEEFELFADVPKQSFLYTLFDIVQGNRRQGGMAVIGLSCDVVRRTVLQAAHDLTSDHVAGMPRAP